MGRIAVDHIKMMDDTDIGNKSWICGEQNRFGLYQVRTHTLRFLSGFSYHFFDHQNEYFSLARLRDRHNQLLHRLCMSAHINNLYCTLIEPLHTCSISYKANRPISSDIGWLDEQTGRKVMITGAWCTICNKFLIGWVAVQYH